MNTKSEKISKKLFCRFLLIRMERNAHITSNLTVVSLGHTYVLFLKIRLRANGIRSRENGLIIHANGIRSRENGLIISANEIRSRENGLIIRANEI